MGLFIVYRSLSNCAQRNWTTAPQSFREAIEDLSRHPAIGGPKALACYIKGDDDDPAEAARWLQRALDPDRREVFSGVHLQRALRLGRQAGCHILWHWLCDKLEYQASEPKAEASRKAHLTRQLAQTKLREAYLIEELESLERSDSVAHLRAAGRE